MLSVLPPSSLRGIRIMPPNLLARLFACLVAALSLLPATLLRAALPTPAQSPRRRCRINASIVL
jgi:hypothetical protein